MITDWFISLAAGMASFFISFIPGGNAVDQGIVHAGDGLTNIFALMGSLGTWVDWFSLSAAITAVMGLYFLTLVVRVIRAVIGHVPAIGGNG